MNNLFNNHQTIVLPDAKTQFKKRIAFFIISAALLLSFLGVQSLPDHESNHTFFTQAASSFK